jgi:hypothetical protein
MITDKTVTPLDWAHGLQKILLLKTQYAKMIKTLKAFINSMTDKSFTMDFLYRADSEI